MNAVIIPEISFASYDPGEIMTDLVTLYETTTGRTLAQGDPIRLFISAIAAATVQERFILDDSARNVMLRYARSEFLDALGDVVGVTRLGARASTCTLEFTLSAAPGAGNSLTIPAGTRVSKGGTTLYWATDYDLIIFDEAVTGSVSATCLTAGIEGNGFGVGEVATIVDVVAGVESAANTSTTTNGSDEEDDEHLRERIRLAPSSFSCAGPRDAYKFWAKSASALVSDVSVLSPAPGEVDVYVLKTGGQLPDVNLLNSVDAILSDDAVRPLTDNVTVKAPTGVDYTIDLEYWIVDDDETESTNIQEAVGDAVDSYILWQSGKIGRDINPSKLESLVMNAGAKRVDITAPVYVELDDTEVAQLSGEADITYSGIEAE